MSFCNVILYLTRQYNTTNNTIQQYLTSQYQHNTHTNSLGKRPPLNRENHTILSLDSNRSTSASHCFHCILHLEQMSVWTEYCNGSVVTHCVLCDCIFVSCVTLLVVVSAVWFALSLSFQPASSLSLPFDPLPQLNISHSLLLFSLSF